jgi:hypothetical protein
MSNFVRITDIDISKPARALAWLRLTEYALVIFCGSWATNLLSDLVITFPSSDAERFVSDLIGSLILGFVAYTVWRHVGVIDPTVWKTYPVVLTLLVLFYLFVVTRGLLTTSRSDTNTMGQETDQYQRVLFVAASTGTVVALLGWISLIRLQRMNVTATGATVTQVLFRLAKNAGVTPLQVTEIKRINKPRGLVLGTGGVLLVLASIIIPALTGSGFLLLIWARKYFQVDANSLLAADRRSPILFLRSFGDDEKQIYRWPVMAFLAFSLEARLYYHFARFGPFVAIGSSKETVPMVGAARVFLSDDEWQQWVLSWIGDAKLIIMYSGTTHWVNWELRQVVKNECATRLILMIPEIRALLWARKEEISARVEQVREGFSGTPWEEELLSVNDFARLRAMLFRPDGSMVMVKSRSKSRDSYHLAALVAHYILIDSDALNNAGTPGPGPSR